MVIQRRNGYRIGENHHRAKLTDAQVQEMREMHEAGKGGYKALAKLFCCGASTARDIITYRTRT